MSIIYSMFSASSSIIAASTLVAVDYINYELYHEKEMRMYTYALVDLCQEKMHYNYIILFLI